MGTTCGARELGQAAISKRGVSGFLAKCRDAFRERRVRQKLAAALDHLSDRELRDIGMTRGEIDYIASNRLIDLRRIRSAEWVRYLPTLDGQFGYLQTDEYTESGFR
jgi:uncharacterized protein YjiS (DUF1127 family)